MVALENPLSTLTYFSHLRNQTHNYETDHLMKKTLLKYLACPGCHSDLHIHSAAGQTEIFSGDLKCALCKETYPIIDGIPRFVPLSNYADSFGYQWTKFDKTQLDDYIGCDMSMERFQKETRWGNKLAGQIILEAGCGMGRFTRCAAETGAEIISIDYSVSIDANYRNNKSYNNVHFIQADIYKLPFKKEIFDKIFCLGVIQHTPDPRKAFFSLLPFGKTGAEIVFDVYRLSWKTLFWGQYYIRPITKRIKPDRLYPLVKKYFNAVYTLTGLIRPINDHLSKAVSLAFGCADYRGMYPISDEKMQEWCLLDTFDKLSPAHDHPQTLRTIRKWLTDAKLIDATAMPGYNGIEARGKISKRLI